MPCSVRMRARLALTALSMLLLAVGNLVPAWPSPTPDERLWLDQDGWTPQAGRLIEALRHATGWGLNPYDYDPGGVLSATRGPLAERDREALGAAMSRAVRRLVSDLHYGRVDPKAVGFDLPARGRDVNPDAVLSRLATAKDPLGELALLEPRFGHYALLKEQLAGYRKLAADPQINRLPPLARGKVEAGGTYPGAPALRRLLIELGDLPKPASAAQPADAAGSSDTLDPQLVEGLRQFQFRHGLQQDGVLGPRTYAALVTPLSFRVQQIELTLERWRWLPAADAPTIIVNVPQFRLFAFASSDDREAGMLTMDVIVGQTFPRTRTPAFAEDMRYVIFRPYWDVPFSILTREMLPRIRAQPNYLVANDLEVVGGAAPTQRPTSEEIAALASGKLRVRQRPGPRNSLGLVKFMLPNRYNVYLHGTPAQDLFKESRRTFSHGCIRVSDPVALAEFVLRQSAQSWPRERIVQAMQAEDSTRVDLARPIRVLIVYGTAVATEAGRIYFFDDIYGNDARLIAALRARK